MDPLRVFCVRTGNRYGKEYVYKLRNMVERYLSVNHEFLCLTDRPDSMPGVHCVLAKNEGWWAKVELFAFGGPALYFDLDTVITGNLLPLAKAIIEDKKRRRRTLYMLEPFNEHRQGWASGVMAWPGSLVSIYTRFTPKHKDFFLWDQKYITYMAKQLNVPVEPVQRFLKVYSYKKHCRGKGLPGDAAIVCFHGKPYLHRVSDSWVEELWQ